MKDLGFLTKYSAATLIALQPLQITLHIEPTQKKSPYNSHMWIAWQHQNVKLYYNRVCRKDF